MSNVVSDYLDAVCERHGVAVALCMGIERRGPWYYLECKRGNLLADELARRWWGGDGDIHTGARQARWIGRETARLKRQAAGLVEGRTAEEKRATDAAAQTTMFKETL